MVDRSVEVKLKADIANFQRNIAKAAVTTDGLAASLGELDHRLGSVHEGQQSAAESQTALNRSWNNGNRSLTKYNGSLSGAESGLGKLDGRTKVLERDTTSLSGKLRAAADDTDRVGTRASSTGKEIDKLSGRLRIWMDLLATGGTALIPLGAGALPALAGITAGLGAAAGALGVTILAVHGLGDALKALDAYQLEPTAANLAKVQDQFHKLGPAGVEFITYLDKLEPKLQDLQMLARQGLLPGLEDGIDSMLQRLPQVKTTISDIAVVLGGIAADAGKNLGGPKFDGFFDYVEHRAGPIMQDFAKATGNVGEGLANMLVAFDPATQDFESGLLGMTRDFANWSRTLDTNTGFQDFLAYARENGPKVIDFLGSLISSLASIVEAAAPVGAVVLPILTDLVKVIGAIAGSDLGTPIFAGLAALATYNRVLQVTASLQKSAFGTAIVGGKSSGVGGKLATTFGGTAIGNIRKDIATLGNATVLAATGETKLKVASASVRENLGGLASGAARAAGPVAALALVSSGAADKMGLQNTTMLGLMGTMAGPWGAALGTAAGAVLDFKSANDASAKSVAATNAVITSSAATLSDQLRQVAQARADYEAQANFDANNGKGQGISGLGDALTSLAKHPIQMAQSAFSDPIDELGNAYAALQAKITLTQTASEDLGRSMGVSLGPIDGSTRSVNELSAALDAAQPAMDALGISQEKLLALQGRQFMARSQQNPGSLFNWGAFGDMSGQADVYDHAIDRIASKSRWLNSTAGRQHAVADALANIGSTATAAVDPVDALAQSLSALLDPAVSFRDAANAFSDQLSGLKDSLAKQNTLTTGLLPIGPADSKNRQVIDDLTRGLQDLLVKQAAVDSSSSHLSQTFRQQRQAIVDKTVAQGLDRKAVEAYLKTLHLAPSDVNTVLHAVVEQAKANVASVRHDFDSLPKDLQTEIKTNGVPKTKSEVDDLITRFGLVGVPRTAIVALKDDAAKAGIATITQLLNALNGKTATTTITTVHRDVRVASSSGVSANPTHNATGGLITGPGGPTEDRIPAMLSNREYVVKAAAVEKYGVGFFDRANAMHLADGGYVDRTGNETRYPVMGGAFGDVRHESDQVAKGLKGLKARLDDAQKALKAEQDQLQKMKDFRSTVSTSLAAPLFGNGQAGFELAATANRNDNRQAREALAKARRKGLDGPLYAALAASGDLAAITQFGNSSRGRIRKDELLYASSVRSGTRLGDLAVQQRFGESIDHQASVIHDLQREIHHLNAELKHLGRHVEKGAHDGTRKGQTDKSRHTSNMTRTGR